MASTRTLRRRRLAAALKKLRSSSKITAEQAASRADISQASLSRIENAVVAIKVNTVKALLDAYEAPPEVRPGLVTLAREANRQGWWQPFSNVLPKWFESYVDLEEEASELGIYDAQFITGLVQTEEYARAIYHAARPQDPAEETDRRVALRMARQQRLVDGKMVLRLVLDEWVLHRAYGSQEIMRAQLIHLCELAALRNVSLQVLPTKAQPGVVGSFTLVDFPNPADESVVYLENELGALYLEKPEEFRAYARVFDRLRAAALSPEDSAVRLAELAKEVGDEAHRQ